MQTVWECEECKNEDGSAYISNVKACEKCGKDCIEKLDTGQRVYRQGIPDYTLKEFNNLERENSELINKWVYQTDNFFGLLMELTDNFSKRKHLQTKFKVAIERGLRKAKLDKDKNTQWGYDNQRRVFVGIAKEKT